MCRVTYQKKKKNQTQTIFRNRMIIVKNFRPLSTQNKITTLLSSPGTTRKSISYEIFFFKRRFSHAEYSVLTLKKTITYYYYYLIMYTFFFLIWS